MQEDPKDALEILLKKYSFWEDIDYKEEIKRKNFLLGRGFNHETINKAIKCAKNRKLEDKD
jgi:SOS response regulatory protein OraA/RecX